MSGSGGYCGGGSGPTKVLGLITDDSVIVPANPATGDITIHGGTGIVTTGNAGAYTVTINSTALGPSWGAITTNTAMVPDIAYMCVGGGNLQLSLPTTSTFGQEIEVVLAGSTGFTITQAAGQQIFIGKLNTTLGASGSLSSTFQGDSVRLVCKTANTVWVALDVVGNLTIV